MKTLKKKCSVLLAMVSLVCVVKVDAQRIVRGTITDSSGEPLIGANNVSEGSMTGTVLARMVPIPLRSPPGIAC